MTRSLRPPYAPMEALSVGEVPVGPEWQYEPKWDGFRCLVFRDGKSVTLQSKSGKPLTRYFLDMVEAVRLLKAKSFVLDGEITVPEGRAFSFDALLQRIHPAATRIKKLSEETPALLILFDMLADGGRVLVDDVLPERRKRLEAFARKYFRRARACGCRLRPPNSPMRKMAEPGRRDARRHHRQAARSALPLGGPHRHAEDQEPPHRRLCGRRLSL